MIPNLNRFSFARVLLAWAVAGLASAARAESLLPALTFDHLFAEKKIDISELHWSDNITVVGRLTRGDDTSVQAWQLDGGPARAITAGAGEFLSPDKTRIITREGEAWVVRETSPEKRELSRIPGPYGAGRQPMVAWSRDSRRIALVQEIRPSTEEIIKTERGVRFVDVGFQADVREVGVTSILTLVDLAESKEPRRFPVEGSMQGITWGATDQLYFVPQRFYTTGGARTATVLSVLQDGQSRELFRIAGFMQTMVPQVSPDGRWIAFACDVDTVRYDNFPSLILVECATGMVRRLTYSQFVSNGSLNWTPDSKALCFTARDGGWSQVYQVDLDGAVSKLTTSPSLKMNLQLAPDGRHLAYVERDGSGRIELRVLETAEKGDRSLAMLDEPATRYRLGRFERVKFPAPDGVQINGWVVYPPDFDPTRKYPVYVDVHGGGPGSNLYLFGGLSVSVLFGPLEWHAFAALGYVVFVPDYRSSGEYGAAFAKAAYERMDFGSIDGDERDLEAGIRWMNSQPYVDTSRVGAFGASAGGPRVTLLLERCALVRAAAVYDMIQPGSLANLIDHLSGPTAGLKHWEVYWERVFNGTLAEKPERYQSGFLFDGYKSKTPTLIMVGNPDKGAVRTMSAEILFSTLRQYRVPARLLRYVDDGHGLLTAASTRHAMEQVCAWYCEHLDMATDVEGRIIFENGKVQSRKDPIR